MTQIWRKRVIFASVHLVLSGVIWGGMQVYQQGHNTTHPQQLAMANVTLGRQQTQIQILEQTFTIPHAWMQYAAEMPYAACLLVGTDVQPWLALLEFTDDS